MAKKVELFKQKSKTMEHTKLEKVNLTKDCEKNDLFSQIMKNKLT